MTPGVVKQGAKCRGVSSFGSWGRVMFCQLRDTGVHNIDNCMVLGKSCQESSMTARAVEVLSGLLGLATRDRAGSGDGQSQ